MLPFTKTSLYSFHMESSCSTNIQSDAQDGLVTFPEKLLFESFMQLFRTGLDVNPLFI